MALEPAKLSEFKLAGALGSGATANVYDAVHVATGRSVAIKVMAEAGSSHELRERFAREALLLAGVDSRHVNKILGFGFDKGQPFLVLERLHGETLDAKLRRDGPVPVPIAVRWIEQLIVGIRDCHDAKVIHRDVKPSNIFLHRHGFDETVKLIDFGVARLREITGEQGGLTSSTHVIGSMGYMAPEQFKSAKTVGYQADLYALGVVIFRTLTGRLPFVSRSLDAIIRMKSEEAPPRISSMPGMTKNTLLDWFVQKAMVRDPAARFQSAREMLEHWWNVIASLEEDVTTDIMRGIGRVDESYAGLRPSAHKPSSPVSAVMVPPTLPSAHPADDEPRTLRRSVTAGSCPMSTEPTTRQMTALRPHEPSSPESGHAGWRTEPRPIASWIEDAPPTVPTGPDGSFAARRLARPRDEEDMPTRSDPNLRKLVERELELEKARRRDGD